MRLLTIRRLKSKIYKIYRASTSYKLQSAWVHRSLMKTISTSTNLFRYEGDVDV